MRAEFEHVKVAVRVAHRHDRPAIDVNPDANQRGRAMVEGVEVARVDDAADASGLAGSSAKVERLNVCTMLPTTPAALYIGPLNAF